jgi:S-adenosyl-L-methionine hydrolase (adenosine-forming)
MAVVTLTTEWKPDDIYSGIIKGRLCSLCPGTIIIDNAWGIPAFNIAQASFVIRNTYSNYPEGSVHIICVHSEAVKGQDFLVVKAKGHFFIGTDNGIFNLILNSEPDDIVKIDAEGISDELEVFAKTASAILSGKKPAQLGQPLISLTERFPLRATIEKDRIIGSIIFIDSYGNAISNITRDVFFRVFENSEYRIMMQSTRNYTDTISNKYSDVPDNNMLARFNRLDLLEISINGADVCEVLSIEIGSVVLIESKFKSPKNNQLF